MSDLVGGVAAAAMMIALTACTPSAPTTAETESTAPTDLASSFDGALNRGGFDYQLGGGYPPTDDVTVVVRDRSDEPASGLYSICYLNAFQTQPDALEDWPADAVLTDTAGSPVRDPDWPDEALLDISSSAGQQIVVDTIGGWIRQCAANGYDGVEFDNLDSFTRSDGRISLDDAIEVAARVVGVAHAEGLAAGQKNAAEFAAPFHAQSGFDFAISEECAAFDECSAYVDVYGESVVNIEYTDNLPRTFAEVCADGGSPPATILRDRDLVTPDDLAYVRETC